MRGMSKTFSYWGNITALAYYGYRTVTCPSKIPLGENAMGPAYLPPLEASLGFQFMMLSSTALISAISTNFRSLKGNFIFWKRKALERTLLSFLAWTFKSFENFFLGGGGRYWAYRAIRTVFKFSLKIRRNAQYDAGRTLQTSLIVDCLSSQVMCSNFPLFY